MWILPAVALLCVLAAASPAFGANPHLHVSAEGHGNRFAGSMVVEVVVGDPRISETGEPKGEPDVTVNGRSLRMVQSSSGTWFGYFAHAGAARAADAAGLDFGHICPRSTPEGTFGISFSETSGFAVARSGGLGEGCTRNANATIGGPALGDVLRGARSVNTNPAVPPGQVGLDPAAWPVIQLYDFADAVVRYDSGLRVQEVSLDYGEIEDARVLTDRDTYPPGAEVFATIHDPQLDQDPTDEDVWTFSPGGTFYMGGPENLLSSLRSAGFADNGRLAVEDGGILGFKDNAERMPALGADAVTFVETSRGSGIFDTVDSSKVSALGIRTDAKRGLAAHLEYNGKKTGIITGHQTATFGVGASLAVGDSGALLPGTRNPVVVSDGDQNRNSDRADVLGIHDPGSIIPTLVIGSPATLSGSRGADLYSGGTVYAADRVAEPDRHSARLHVTPRPGSYDRLEIETAGAGRIAGALAQGAGASSWLHYDIRSLAAHADLSGGSISLESGGASVNLAGPGIASSGLVLIPPEISSQIRGMSGSARLVIEADIRLSTYAELPLVADFVSFGAGTNNAIYRMELEETTASSGRFEGTIEYVVANQINISDPAFFEGMELTGDRVRFAVTGSSADRDGLYMSYSDIDSVGVRTTVSARPVAETHTGVVTVGGQLRFGWPVTITLSDLDLNLDSDLAEVYGVVDDPSSPVSDAVGSGGRLLLEVLIKGERYKRCTVGGTEHGGLASTGFSLVETGRSTGVFEGSFNMPSRICSPDGTRLVSPAGGGIGVRYHDARDASGSPRVTGLSPRDAAGGAPSVEPAQDPAAERAGEMPPSLSASRVERPPPGDPVTVVVSGRLGSGVPGLPVDIRVSGPGGGQSLESEVLSGRYSADIMVDDRSGPGRYQVEVLHGGNRVGVLFFEVSAEEVPGWARDWAGRWSSGEIPDADFVRVAEELAGTSGLAPREGPVPGWLRSSAGWWADGTIGDEEFSGALRYLVDRGIIRP